MGFRLWPDTRRGLDFSPQQREEYIRTLKQFQADRVNWTMHEWMHHDLTVLDDKTNALLAVNSIAIAVLTIYTQSETALRTIPKFFLAMGFILLVWSILVLLRVSYVYWNSKEELTEPDAMHAELLLVRNLRSAIIRRSVVKISVATFLFAIAFLLQAAAIDFPALEGWIQWLPNLVGKG